MSRICVKNLAADVSESQLRAHFSGKGEVTDCRLVRTKSGKSRRFAFIGFRSEEQANEAVKYFHNTFLLTNRIHVESAARVGDETVLQKSRSKYSLAKVRKLERGKGMEREEANEWKKKQLEASLSLSKRPIDKKKLDFLEAMKARRNAKFWGNDEGMNLPVEPTTEEEENSNRPLRSTTSTKENGNEVTTDDDEDSGAESETSANLEDEEEEEQKEEKEKEEDVKMDAMSDMDFLRSKIKTSAVKAEAAQESESQLDCPQNSDREMRGKKKVRAEVNKESGSFPVKGSHFEEKEKEEEQGEEEEEEADRLFVRNLPFLCTEDDLRALLMPLGPLAAVHIPLSDAKQYRGFGYVHFMLPEDADKAIDSLHGTSFQGRVLYITKAKKAPQPSTSSEGAVGGSKGKLSSYQQAKEDQRRKLLGKKDGWNASFVRSDTVIESLADKYGVSRSEILDTGEGGGELAVRLAMGETHVLQENRDFFLSHGVNLSALESAYSGSRAASRSTTTLLIKNLPHDLIPEEIEDMFARYGALSSFLVPPSKTLALIDFVEPSEARAAFRGLSYRKYKHVPLYLEWAPQGIISATAASKKSSEQEKEAMKPKLRVDVKDLVESDENFSSLFIKNLNFTTTESTLKAHIEKLMCASLRAVSIPMKRKPDGAMLSMGYGFAEFRTLESATAALKVLAGSVLEGHALEVKPSDKRISVASNNKRPLSGGKAGDNKNTKIIVRNVAFQASVEELKSLFSSFGAVKRVRIPKKLGGVHRGFAFVDFASSQEASSAMDALSSTHLYGRHLVLEWAKEDEEGDLEVEQLRKKARVDVKTAIKVSGGSTGGKGAVSVDKVLEEQMDRNVLSEDPPSDAED